MWRIRLRAVSRRASLVLCRLRRRRARGRRGEARRRGLGGVGLRGGIARVVVRLGGQGEEEAGLREVLEGEECGELVRKDGGGISIHLACAVLTGSRHVSRHTLEQVRRHERPLPNTWKHQTPQCCCAALLVRVYSVDITLVTGVRNQRAQSRKGLRTKQCQYITTQCTRCQKTICSKANHVQTQSVNSSQMPSIHVLEP